MQTAAFAVARTSTRTDVHNSASSGCSMTLPSDQNAPVLTSEDANALLLTENYGAYTAENLHKANVENFSESEPLHGKFTAHLYDRVLPALNESIKRLKAGEEINGFSGERRVGAYLESIGYSADLVRQWNKRYPILKPLRSEKGNTTLGTGNEQFDPTLFPLAEILICGDLEPQLFRVELQRGVLVTYWNSDDIDCTNHRDNPPRGTIAT
jgi:hypothetical protein